jgi:hypothetical protein
MVTCSHIYTNLMQGLVFLEGDAITAEYFALSDNFGTKRNSYDTLLMIHRYV